MRRRDLLKSALPTALAAFLPVTTSAQSSSIPTNRSAWLDPLQRVAHPVLDALAHRRLKATMPIECAPGQLDSRRLTTHLEAIGRLLAGIAPWLDLPYTGGPESDLRARYITLTHDSLAAIFDPASPDHIDFGADRQNLVDAAFLALAILRAPRTLNASLAPEIRHQLAQALAATRKFEPPQSNWLLFSAAVEAALHALNEPFNHAPIETALQHLNSWYLGDGTYGDGPHLHADYYNSYVIHPFLLAILDAVAPEDPAWQSLVPSIHKRAQRYAHIQALTIAPDGSYPPLGRSITYRCGAFHHLADTALRNLLPSGITPAQTRCALAAVIHRTLIPPDTFDSNGFLRIGLSGHQPSLGETYISTGSLYLCSTAFLPLGLPATDPFWSTPDEPLPSQQLWSGHDQHADHFLDT